MGSPYKLYPLLENVKQILGKKVYMWFWPFSLDSGSLNGLEYDYRKIDDEYRKSFYFRQSA